MTYPGVVPVVSLFVRVLVLVLFFFLNAITGQSSTTAVPFGRRRKRGVGDGVGVGRRQRWPWGVVLVLVLLLTCILLHVFFFFEFQRVLDVFLNCFDPFFRILQPVGGHAKIGHPHVVKDYRERVTFSARVNVTIESKGTTVPQ